MIRKTGLILFLFILTQYVCSFILGKYYFNFLLNPIINFIIIWGTIKLIEKKDDHKEEDKSEDKWTLLKTNRYIFIGLLSLFFFARILIDLLIIIDKGYEHYSNANERIGFTRDMRVLFFTALIVAPIMEEKLFRQKILNTFLIKFSKMESVIMVSFLFALVHMVFSFHIDTLIVQFLLSVLLSFVYLKSKSLFIARMAHFFWNILWYLEAIILGYSQIYFSFTYSYFYLTCMLLLSVFLFIRFYKSYTPFNAFE